MDKTQCETLILTTNITALRQWKEELLDKTTIPAECIGEYSGELTGRRPGRGCFQPHRPQKIRCAVEGAGEKGMDCLCQLL